MIFISFSKISFISLSNFYVFHLLKPLAKSILIPLGLTAAALASDAGVHKKILQYAQKYNISNIKRRNGTYHESS